MNRLSDIFEMSQVKQATQGMAVVSIMFGNIGQIYVVIFL